MNFEEFANLRLTVKYGGFTPAQLILLFGDLTFRICDRDEFEPLKQEASDLEEVMVETLDKYEEAEANARPYEPDPADLVHVD